VKQKLKTQMFQTIFLSADLKPLLLICLYQLLKLVLLFALKYQMILFYPYQGTIALKFQQLLGFSMLSLFK